jgi:hypothetical protein
MLQFGYVTLLSFHRHIVRLTLRSPIGKPEFGRKIKMSKRKMPNATKTENKVSKNYDVER